MSIARPMRRSVLATVFSVVAIALVPARAVVAATIFTVNVTTDGQDAVPGDGTCDNGGGFCTLRAAVMESNALAGSDDITIPAGTYTLTIGGASENAAATGISTSRRRSSCTGTVRRRCWTVVRPIGCSMSGRVAGCSSGTSM